MKRLKYWFLDLFEDKQAKTIAEAERKGQEHYNELVRKRNEIINTPIPNCDGTYNK
jgi:hypothetical protein